MSDEDMTPEEFDDAMEHGEPVELNVSPNLRVWSTSPFLIPQAQTTTGGGTGTTYWWAP